MKQAVLCHQQSSWLLEAAAVPANTCPGQPNECPGQSEHSKSSRAAATPAEAVHAALPAEACSKCCQQLQLDCRVTP